MQLYSTAYLLFCLVTLVIFACCNKSGRRAVLFLGSIVFYGYADPVLLWYALTVVAIVYGVIAGGSTGNRVQTSVGIILLLAILFLFKYSMSLLGWMGLSENRLSGFVTLLYPLGISYITFQAVGLLLDFRNNALTSKPDILDVGVYLLFFPKVVSGPVEKAYKFIPQLKELVFSPENVRIGLLMIAWGCFKKLVISDKLGIAVDKFYAAPDVFNNIDATVITVAYALQVYVDFSAYSDMALGTCLLFGVKVTQNFRGPFLARSVTEFWRRWHISLGQWFNEYWFSFVSLRLRSFRNIGVYTALLSTFLLIGLWHGPTSGFVIFGLLHGLMIVYELKTRKWRKQYDRWLPGRLNILRMVVLTFSFYCLSCVFFRSASFDQSIQVLGMSLEGVRDILALVFAPEELIPAAIAIATKFGYYKLDIAVLTIAIAVLFVVDIGKNMEDLNGYIDSQIVVIRWGFYYFLAIFVLFFGSFNSVQSFIYKQF